jgi:hypothetical protein
MMSDLLPEVPPPNTSDEEEEQEQEQQVQIGTGEEGEVQVYEPPEVKRHVLESEVFPDMQIKEVAPAKLPKPKRKPSKKQLEHLARARKIAADKRARVPKKTPAARYTAHDMEQFASEVLDKYVSNQHHEARRTKPVAQPVVVAPIQPAVPVKSQEDQNYEFWQQYF